jgi:putative flippase GtrA
MLKSLARKRLIRFLSVGISMAVFFMVLTYVLILAGLSPFWGASLAYAVSFGAAYALQRVWTFETDRPHREVFSRYLALQAICASSSGLFAHITVDYLGMSHFLASSIVTVLVAIMSFIGSAFWVFSDGQTGSIWSSLRTRPRSSSI